MNNNSPYKRVLLLGGTEDARHIADLLIEAFPTERTNLQLIYSLAGVTESPYLPKNIDRMILRQGGFGGIKKLQTYLHDMDAVIDATHPFATQISHHISIACKYVQCPLLRYQRKAWQIKPSSQPSCRVIKTDDDIKSALKHHPQARHVLIALGHKSLPHLLPIFASDDFNHQQFYLRLISPPQYNMPEYSMSENCHIIMADLPFTAQKETDLLKSHAIDLLICRNSGAESSQKKLTIAQQLHIPIILLEQPALPNDSHSQTNEKQAVIDFIKNNLLS